MGKMNGSGALSKGLAHKALPSNQPSSLEHLGTGKHWLWPVVESWWRLCRCTVGVKERLDTYRSVAVPTHED